MNITCIERINWYKVDTVHSSHLVHVIRKTADGLGLSEDFYEEELFEDLDNALNVPARLDGTCTYGDITFAIAVEDMGVEELAKAEKICQDVVDAWITKWDINSFPQWTR